MPHFMFSILFCRPENWSMEQLNPNVCANLIYGSVCKTVFSVTRMVHHHGNISTGLFMSIAFTVSSATNSGSRIGTTWWSNAIVLVIFNWNIEILIISLLCSFVTVIILLAYLWLNSPKHSSWYIVRANNGGFYEWWHTLNK